ncbi:hypothetical protein [Streptomyces sp. NPDC046909]|uniref:hypothetical protein n=1 Tax=Streptomyces sp. NPDC046909 TaxID=3155617 RepID=UPI0033D7081F
MTPDPKPGTPYAMTDPLFPVHPPVPVAGCVSCESLAARREAARTALDHSARTDANVLLRLHLRQEHRT